MPAYYFLYLFVLLVILFLLARFFFLKSKPLPMQLFLKGLQTENNGNFEEASVIYENALCEVKKVRFHHLLQKTLVEKLKLLEQIKKYNLEQDFVRENDSWLKL